MDLFKLDIFKIHKPISEEEKPQYLPEKHVQTMKAEDLEKQYILVKTVISPNSNPQKSNTKNSLVLHPVHVVEDHQKLFFGAFERELLNEFLPPHQNNLNHLKIILKTLAIHQAEALATNAATSSEYPVKALIEDVISLDHFKAIDKVSADRTLDKLQKKIGALFQTGVFVETVWCSWNNVLVKNGADECRFLQLSPPVLFPPLFDALLYIFSLSDAKFRQKHFNNTITYYLKVLAELLEKQKKERFSRSYEEFQLKTLLPVAKFQYAHGLIKFQEASKLNDIMLNLSNYLKNPLIQQEDIYTVIKNKVLVDEYDLVSYELVPLDTKNGHLGEYYHLKVSIDLEGTRRSFVFFAKFLTAGTEVMQDLLEKGAGKKEDFFYNTLYPLFQENGLEDLLDFAPKCYLSGTEFLILENLITVGYIGLKPNSTLSLDGLKIVLGKLSKFHSSTIIFEEILSKKLGKKVRLGDTYKDYLKESLILYEDNLKSWYDRSVDSLCYITNKFPDLRGEIEKSDEELWEIAQQVLFSNFEKVKSLKNIRNVINHGDMYIANMMVKLGNDGTVDDAVLIDFQMLRYLPPAYEVMFFIYLSSTKGTRNKHFNSLLNWYYDDFCKHLKHFKLDPEEIFPRQHFDENVEYARSAAFATAFEYGHVIYTDPDLREEILHDQEKYTYYITTNKKEFLDLSWKIDHYRAIMKGFVEDFVDIIKSGAYLGE